MTIRANFVGKLRKIVRNFISFLTSRRSFADQFLEELVKVRPHEFASKVEFSLAVDSFRGPLIEFVTRKYGDEVMRALSDSQKMAVLEGLYESHLLDVITAINSRPGGSFKYVGNEDVRVIIGSGPQRMKGWLATDIQQLNVAEDSSWRRLFDLGSIDRVLAEHVLEHLSLRELHDALEHVIRYLKPGGLLRLAVPDAFHPSRYYYNLVKPGGWETPYGHMLFLDHEMLFRIARGIGFEVRLLEYFDENGIFHSTDYTSEDGIIQRCASHNAGLDINDREVMAKFHASIPQHLRQQFVDRRMSYTSLIADLVKPK